MNRRHLRVLLALALATTIAAALFPTDDGSVVGPAARTGAASGAIAAATAAAAATPVESVAQVPPAQATAAGRGADTGTVSATPAAGIAIPDLARMRRAPSVIEGRDPFVLALPPPPPVPRPREAVALPALPPPLPVAPALPFRMIGSIDEEGRVTVFAERVNGDVVALRVADIVDNTYRVDAINARSMTLTYLPLGQQQTLPFGEAIR